MDKLRIYKKFKKYYWFYYVVVIIMYLLLPFCVIFYCFFMLMLKIFDHIEDVTDNYTDSNVGLSMLLHPLKTRRNLIDKINKMEGKKC